MTHDQNGRRTTRLKRGRSTGNIAPESGITEIHKDRKDGAQVLPEPAKAGVDLTIEDEIEIDFDPELEAKSAICESKHIRLVHEAQRSESERKEVHKALDRLIEEAQNRSSAQMG